MKNPKTRKIFRWIFAALCICFAFVCNSVVSSVFLILAAVTTAPIEPIQSKLKKPLNIVLPIVFFVAAVVIAPTPEKTEAPEEVAAVQTAEPVQEEPTQEPEDQESTGAEHTLKFGELQGWTENEIEGKKVLVVKAKIEASLTDKMTINQNFHNVSDIVKNQNGAEFDEIQYWAVADMSNGSEGKVISFTLDKSTIQGILDGNIPDSELRDYVSDLYILPSLAG